MILAGLLVGSYGCSILVSRPVQEMSDTAAAIKAAKEVQADTLSPELYRQANEWYTKAKREYKFKDFRTAIDSADKARRFAEQAEFDAIRGGGTRAESQVDAPTPPPQPAPAKESYAYPSPTGTPADVYDQRKAEEERRNNPAPSPTAAPSGAPVPVPPPS